MQQYYITVPSIVYHKYTTGDDYWFYGKIIKVEPGRLYFAGTKPTSMPPVSKTTNTAPAYEPAVFDAGESIDTDS